jgi:hypothetical protein
VCGERVTDDRTKDLLKFHDLDRASRHGNWYWMIKQLKNYSLHDSLISSQILELAPSFKTRIKIIPCFEQFLNQLMKLIDNTKMKEYRPQNSNKT